MYYTLFGNAQNAIGVVGGNEPDGQQVCFRLGEAYRQGKNFSVMLCMTENVSHGTHFRVLPNTVLLFGYSTCALFCIQNQPYVAPSQHRKLFITELTHHWGRMNGIYIVYALYFMLHANEIRKIIVIIESSNTTLVPYPHSSNPNLVHSPFTHIYQTYRHTLTYSHTHTTHNAHT